jgi:hypothetical protein
MKTDQIESTNPEYQIESTNPESGVVSKSRFCALAYAPMSGEGRLAAAEHVILLAIEDSGALRFLVHPNLKSVVNAVDFAYIESILKDFVERINRYATELFQQLCSLSVGPLQTHTVGDQLCEHPDIHSLVSQFVALEY